jgi:hypothetical protein
MRRLLTRLRAGRGDGLRFLALLALDPGFHELPSAVSLPVNRTVAISA